MDIIAIKETPAANFYDGLGALKGVDITAASLGFKIINNSPRCIFWVSYIPFAHSYLTRRHNFLRPQFYV